MKLGAGLIATITDKPDSLVLDRFFDGYTKAFVLPSELEDKAGFRKCLEMNYQEGTKQNKHREMVMIITDEQTDELLGGASFMAAEMPLISGHPPISVALNYLFVEQEVRGRGLSRKLLEAVSRAAHDALGQPEHNLPPAIFIEQNDPLLMSAEDYAIDSAECGTDQVDRLKIWSRLGAQVIDFAYIQPALSEQGGPNESLAYAVVGFPTPQISARYLLQHLEIFFRLSVLKGADVHQDPTASAQIKELQRLAREESEIDILPMTDILDNLKRDIASQHGVPLRSYIQSMPALSQAPIH